MAFDAGDIESSLTLDRSPFSREARVAKSQGDAMERDPIDVKLQLEGTAELAVLRAALSALDGRRLDVDLNISPALSRLAILEVALKRVSGTIATVGAKPINIYPPSVSNRTNASLRETSDLLNRMELSLRGASRRGGGLGIFLTTIPRLAVNAGRAVQGLTEFTLRSASAFDSFGKVIIGLPGSLTGIGAALTRSATALPGLLGGLSAAVVLLPAFISAISLAGGVVTAFASALAFAISGSILPATALLLPLATGAGVLAIAISGMTDEMKASLNPIRDWYNAVKAPVAERVFANLEEQVARVIPVLEEFGGPILNRMAAAISDVMDAFSQAVESEGVARFLKVFQETAPDIVRNLGVAFVDLGEGLAGFFTPILPYAERLSEKIGEIATRFSEWANSAAGQNSIADFMERAWEAASNLWSALGNVVGAVSNILSLGEEAAGGSFLEWLVNITEEFEKWTASDEGREAIKQWFTDAKDFGKQLWEIIQEIAKAFDEFDTEQARADLETILGVVNDIASAVTFMSETFAAIRDSAGFQDVIAMLDTLATTVGAVFGDEESQEKVRAWAEGINTAIDEWLQGLQTSLSEWFSSLPGKIGEWIAGVGEAILGPFRDAYNALVGNSIVPDLVNATVTWFASLPGKIVAALAGVVIAILSPFIQASAQALAQVQGFVTGVAAWLGTLPGRAMGALGGFAAAVVSRIATAFPGAIAAVQGGIGTIVGILGGLAGRAASAVGNLGGILVGAGRSLIQGLISGVNSAIGGLQSALGRVTSLIPSWKGPRERDRVLLKPAGQSIMEGLIGGIEDRLSPLRATLRGVTDEIGVGGALRGPGLGVQGLGAGSGGTSFGNIVLQAQPGASIEQQFSAIRFQMRTMGPNTKPRRS